MKNCNKQSVGKRCRVWQGPDSRSQACRVRVMGSWGLWERGWEFTTLNHVLLLSSLKTSCLPNLPCPTIDQTCHQSEKTEASHTDTDETKDRGLGCMWYADDDWIGVQGMGGGKTVSLQESRDTFLWQGKGKKQQPVTVLKCWAVSCCGVRSSLLFSSQSQILWALFNIIKNFCCWCFFFPLFGTTFPLEFLQRTGEVNKPLLILRYVGGGCGPIRAGRELE